MSFLLIGASLLEFTNWSQNIPSPFLGILFSPSLQPLNSHSHLLHDSGIPRAEGGKPKERTKEHSRGPEGGGRGSVEAVFINS